MIVSIAKRNRGLIILCILLFLAITLCGFLSAFSIRITVEGGCGSTYVVGDSIEFYIYVSESAYVDIWVVTSDGSWDIMKNTYLHAGTHAFSGVVGSSENTHIVYVEARGLYGDIEYDSCSYYVSDAPLPTPSPKPEPTETDSDGDTIPNDVDQCSNPECYEIDHRGCPKDSDNDGVQDCDDACDFFPGSLDNDGCPELEKEVIEDSDGDGWPDEQEKQAGTNPGSVDTDGDGIWDSRDPNPLKAEITDTDVIDKQTQMSLAGNLIKIISPVVVAVGSLVGGYYFFKRRQKGKKLEQVEDFYERKKQRTEKLRQIRELKAQYVYGELSKDEYQKKLEELERSDK